MRWTNDLKLHCLAIELDGSDFLRGSVSPRPAGNHGAEGVSTYEVNADGRDVALSVGVVGESEQQTRLSDTGVTDQKELEKVVVSVESLYERHVLRGSLSGRWRRGCC